MAKFTAAAKKFVLGEEGATMVEYALMVAFIAMACFAAVTALGTSISGLFGETGGKLDAIEGSGTAATTT